MEWLQQGLHPRGLRRRHEMRAVEPDGASRSFVNAGENRVHLFGSRRSPEYKLV